MSYQVNAWLDTPLPQIDVINLRTGACILSFQSDEVRQLLENGDIDLSDLFSTESQTLENLVRELALFRCAKSFGAVEGRLERFIA